MTLRLKLITAPADEPVELVTEVKPHCRVEINDDDALLLIYMAAAREWAEDFRRQSFITQTWEIYFDTWPTLPVELPRGPVQSITHIKYTDVDGNESTFSSDNYLLDVVSEPARLTLKSTASWPTVELRELNGVYVRYVAGYGDAPTDVPQSVRQAILLLTGHLYENREQSVAEALRDIPFGVQALLRPRRVLRF